MKLYINIYIYLVLNVLKVYLKISMWQLIKPSTCTFSNITYLMNHVTCLNNICE